MLHFDQNNMRSGLQIEIGKKNCKEKYNFRLNRKTTVGGLKLSIDCVGKEVIQHASLAHTSRLTKEKNRNQTQKPSG